MLTLADDLKIGDVVVAHKGAVERTFEDSVGVFIFSIGEVVVVGLGIVQGRCDDVAPAGPLAEIDHTATLAAERKLGFRA